jgi:predicted dehydrogenase
MTILRAAVVGTGFIGPVHVEAIRRLGHTVVGVLGSSPAKSTASANSLHVPRGYTSFDEVLRDADVDIVVLASPNVLHFDHTKRAILAGKHVVCEKPLAMNTTETAELVKLAKEHPHLVTAVNYNCRFYPCVLELRARREAMGKLFHVSGAYLQDWLLYPTDFNWRVIAADGGALRSVADIGTHWLDTVQFITGQKVTEVFADLQTVHDARMKPIGGSETFTGSANSKQETTLTIIDNEDAGMVLLRFSDGGKGCMAISQISAGKKNSLRFELACANSSASWDSEDPNTLHLGYRDKPNERLVRDPGLMHASVGPYANYPGGHAEGFPDTFKQFYRAVLGDLLRPVAQREKLYATFEDGHREVQFCEAVLKSHTEQRWVTVG